MKRKEAIQILSTRDKYGVPCGYTSGYQEALDMAIEALTQNSSQDLISKQSAIKAMCNAICENDVTHYLDCNQIKYCDEFQALISFPSIDLKKMVGCTGCVHYDEQQTAMICRDCKRYYRDMYEDGDKVTIMGKDKI